MVINGGIKPFITAIFSTVHPINGNLNTLIDEKTVIYNTKSVDAHSSELSIAEACSLVLSKGQWVVFWYSDLTVSAEAQIAMIVKVPSDSFGNMTNMVIRSYAIDGGGMSSTVVYNIDQNTTVNLQVIQNITTPSGSKYTTYCIGYKIK